MRLDVINLIIDLVVGEWYNLVSAQQIHVCVYTHLTHMYFLLTIYRVNTNFETFFRNKLRRKKKKYTQGFSWYANDFWAIELHSLKLARTGEIHYISLFCTSVNIVYKRNMSYIPLSTLCIT